MSKFYLFIIALIIIIIIGIFIYYFFFRIKDNTKKTKRKKSDYVPIITNKNKSNKLGNKYQRYDYAENNGKVELFTYSSEKDNILKVVIIYADFSYIAVIDGIKIKEGILEETKKNLIMNVLQNITLYNKSYCLNESYDNSGESHIIFSGKHIINLGTFNRNCIPPDIYYAIVVLKRIFE